MRLLLRRQKGRISHAPKTLSIFWIPVDSRVFLLYNRSVLSDSFMTDVCLPKWIIQISSSFYRAAKYKDTTIPAMVPETALKTRLLANASKTALMYGYVCNLVSVSLRAFSITLRKMNEPPSSQIRNEYREQISVGSVLPLCFSHTGL